MGPSLPNPQIRDLHLWVLVLELLYGAAEPDNVCIARSGAAHCRPELLIRVKRVWAKRMTTTVDVASARISHIDKSTSRSV